MATETTNENRINANKRLACPSCGTKGRKVGSTTLRALLCDEYGDDIIVGEAAACCDDAIGCKPVDPESIYRFCDRQECDVVYFAEDSNQTFTQRQLEVTVGAKQSAGERPLCYCFGHSVATIKNELQTIGCSSSLEDIRAKMKDPGCRCETENPSGACCLGSVAKGIEIAQAELGDGESNEPVDSHDEPPAADSATGGNRGELIAKVGTLISAVMASACCWLPLLLLAVGVSGAGIAATLEAYRPTFIVVTFGFLAASFYFTYRPRKATASGGVDCCTPKSPTSEDYCAAPTSPVEDCCSTTTSKRGFSMMTLNKVMLWVVTVLAIALLLFPTYVSAFLGSRDGNTVTDEMNQAVFQVEGMTCEGCESIAEKAIRDVPGVLAAEVDYETGRAVVGTEICCPVPVEGIQSTLNSAEYTGRLIEPIRSVSDQTEPSG